MEGFNESRFRAKVDEAMAKVRLILDTDKKPTLAEGVSHEYDDKYLLAELLVNSGLNALVQALDAIGVTAGQFETLHGWNATRTVTLRFKAEERCKFLRKVEREVESDTKHVTQSTLFGTSKSYTVTKVTEWFWAFTASYELQAVQGNDYEHPLVLRRREATIELKTSADATPRPVSVVRPALDVNVSWFLKQVDGKKSNEGKFSIDRAADDCHTPRRNEPVEEALHLFAGLFLWAGNVSNYLRNTLIPTQPNHGFDLAALKDSGIFVPVLPLFDGQGKKKKSSKSKSKSKSKEKEKDAAPVVPGTKLNYLTLLNLLSLISTDHCRLWRHPDCLHEGLLGRAEASVERDRRVAW